MMKFAKRFWSLLLCAALLIGYMPLFPQVSAVAVAREAVVGTVTDPGTADAWETMMGTDADGNRLTLSEGLSALADGKHTITVTMQLSTGEKLTAFTGTLTA